MPKTTSAIIESPHAQEIIEKYKALNMLPGFNLSQFYRDNVGPMIPGYSYESFRQFVKKLRRELGLPDVKMVSQSAAAILLPEEDKNRGREIVLMKGDEATRRGIELALNIGAKALAKIASGESNLSEKDQTDLMFKAMKAQDSRIVSMAKVRQDKRSQIAFEHVFGDAAYAEENE
jgi:hypothetical protein